MNDDMRLAALLVAVPFSVAAVMIVLILLPDGISAVMLMLSAVLFIWGILLLSGRALWTVAGVNVMTAAEKKKVDMKKVGNTVGLLLIGGAVLVLCICSGSIAVTAVLTAAFVAGTLWVAFGVDYGTLYGIRVPSVCMSGQGRRLSPRPF